MTTRSSWFSFRTVDTAETARLFSPVSRDLSVTALARDFQVEAHGIRLERTGIARVRVQNTHVIDVRDECAFTIPLDGRVCVRDSINATDVTSGAAYAHLSGGPIDLKMADRTSFLVAKIDTEFLHSTCLRLGVQAPASRVISLATRQGASLGRFVSFLTSELERGSALLDCPTAIHEMEGALVALFLHALEAESSASTPSAATSRLRVAEEFIMAHLTRPISVVDIAVAAGVRPRTLFKMFRKHYGVGPVALLRERRLEAAHRALLAADPESETVTGVATRFGFYHFGRFAERHRELFQELPSETLQK